MEGFYGGLYFGFMGGVVFSSGVALLVVLSGGLLKKKDKGLEITINVPETERIETGDMERARLLCKLQSSQDTEREFLCPALGFDINEKGCRFHRMMSPEACVNCLISLSEEAVS